MFTLMPYITKLTTLPPYVTTLTLRGLLFYLQVIYNLLSKDKYPNKLALIWVGFLGVRFEVGGGGLTRKYTGIRSLRTYTF